MKVTLVVPFIDTPNITRRCIEKIIDNTKEPIELILIDNDSDSDYEDEYKKLTSNSLFEYKYIKNNKNRGVLATFKQGLEKSSGDIVCFIHSDVLIQEENWSKRVRVAFENNQQLGLAGIFGAVGVGSNGGRIRSQSNIQGIEWGACECHEKAWQHHSELQEGLAPATILDGVGMFFSRKALQSLVETDMFDSWRAPHHFYDRIMPLKLIDKGFRIATIGIAFDHYSGATANSSEKWVKSAKNWCIRHGVSSTGSPDNDIYLEAERQFFSEFGNRLPCNVDSNWNYIFGGIQ